MVWSMQGRGIRRSQGTALELARAGDLYTFNDEVDRSCQFQREISG